MAASTSKKVLIVEDNEIISLLTERHLHQMGYTAVHKVTSGEKAVEISKQLQPDLVIMDIYLSGELDGFEAIRRIKKVMDVHVIFLSGISYQNEMRDVLKEECHEFITKPVTYDNLSKAIKSVWNGKQQNNSEFATKS